MYGIYRAGADGSLATLIGSRASDSGGNSMAPAGLIDLSVRPTKVDRASDVTGLVDTGQLANLLSVDDTVVGHGGDPAHQPPQAAGRSIRSRTGRIRSGRP